MARYGALIDSNSGNPFITPVSTPFVLYAKVSASSVDMGAGNKGANGSVALDPSYPAMVFLRSDNRCSMSAARVGGQILFGGSIQGQSNPHFTVTAYIFARFPQPLPKYGMAIWDDAGTCILTNESKVLTDLVTVGTVGNGGGINIDQTLPGQYAVSPMILGAQLVMIYVQGQPQVINVTASTGAYNYNGGTRILPVLNQAVSGSPAGSLNTGVTITAIDVSSL